MIVVYHRPHSSRRLEDFVRTATAFDIVDLIVLSKLEGSAVQPGIANIHVEVYKKNKRLLIVNDLQDAIDLLKPERVITISRIAEKDIKDMDILKLKDKNVMIIFFEGLPTKNELNLGDAYYICKEGISVIAEASIFLYISSRCLQNRSN